MKLFFLNGSFYFSLFSCSSGDVHVREHSCGQDRRDQQEVDQPGVHGARHDRGRK
jgi:hypothetical protein